MSTNIDQDDKIRFGLESRLLFTEQNLIFDVGHLFFFVVTFCFSSYYCIHFTSASY